MSVIIYGKQEIETCLLTAARYMHFIQDHVVTCLNKSMILEETVNSLKMPDELMNSKWLPPLYGHPVFIARAIFKRYAGYYSGRPAELFPPDYAALGHEVVDLAGGAEPREAALLATHSAGLVVSEVGTAVPDFDALRASFEGAR